MRPKKRVKAREVSDDGYRDLDHGCETCGLLFKRVNGLDLSLDVVVLGLELLEQLLSL